MVECGRVGQGGVELKKPRCIGRRSGRLVDERLTQLKKYEE
jgi:hypothetical protein